METRKWILGTCLAIAALFIACSDDEKGPDNPGKAPNAAIEKAFTTQFAQAEHVEWTQQNGYFVARFNLPDSKAASVTSRNAAWYKENGRCVMTELDLASLPQAVQKGWEATTFFTQGYTIDDIDLLERNGNKTYKVEVELKGKEDVDLFFSETGNLLSVKPDSNDPDNDDDNIPTPEKIADFIHATYPGAHIIECEAEQKNNNTYYEVEFIDDESVYNKEEGEYDYEKEALFDKDMVWLKTITEIPYAGLPEAVKNALRTLYPGAETDDIERWEEKEDKTTYVIEIEDPETENDQTVRFDKEGNKL